MCCSTGIYFIMYYFIYWFLTFQIVDGTVVWAEFGKTELGNSLSAKEMDKLLQNIYGDNILNRPKSTISVAEDPSQLYLPKISAEISLNS